VSRFLTVFLVVTLGAPASVWAGQAIPNGIEKVGANCCGPQTDIDPRQEQPLIEKACCCSPSSVLASSTTSQLGPPADDSPLLAVNGLTFNILPVVPALRTQSTPGSARPPPPPWGLLAQRTSLVL
jgi:hypothetical protein